ncbi:TraB family protein [Rhynchospora pubera]|uniref:TraB family protein n=1 Tax=Rhynchospora pubera TaxID=906938 RepID=A0AAV8DRY8_9POAL|nr:TraB family protein [Rhynchospora pubera]
MFQFRSIQIQFLNSPFLPKFSIKTTRLPSNRTSRKPFSSVSFFPSLLASMDPSSAERSHEEESPESRPSSPDQSTSEEEDFSGVSSVDEIVKGLVHLQCQSSVEEGLCHVYLVGTAHVSQESCKEVKTVIRYLKPQVVFLELCPSRVNILTPQNFEVPTMSEMFDMWKNKKANPFGILYSWFLAKVASKLEVLPGAEFRVAYEEAMSYGARVILGDRPVQITLRRTWNGMSTWHKMKFLYDILFQSVFLPGPDEIVKMLKEMDDADALTVVVQEMSKAFPTLMETLIVERDMYMSQALWRVAREHSSVVAVVGKGHLSGIKKNWMQPVEVASLLEVPSTNKGIGMFKIFASVGAVTCVVVASGIYFWSKK